jgi:hypothetical protein
MKKKFILLALFGGLSYVILPGYATGPAGSGYERTGATGAIGCGSTPSCHSNAATGTTTVNITVAGSSGTVTSYTPGSTYTITMTGGNTSSSSLPYFGYQVTAVKGSPVSNAGTMTAPSGSNHVVTASGISVCEHTSPLAGSGSGGAGTTYTVNIPWTAPAAGSGTVTIRAVLNAVNHNGNQDAGDLWNYTSTTLSEATSSSISPITGTLSICIAANTPLADATSGGTWSSSTTSVATINSSGVVTGISAGTSTISYITGTGNATAVVTVNGAPVATITGYSTVCVGHTITLAGAPTSGVWTSSTPSKATVVLGTGVVTGVATGTDTIKYKVSGACGTDSTKKVITVTPASPCVNAVYNPFAEQDEVKLFPNPNRGTFSINVLATIDEEAHVTVTNVVGGKVKEYTIPTNAVQTLTMGQPAGVYFLSVVTTTQKYFVKMVVE